MTRTTLNINLSVEKVFVMTLYITKPRDFIKILGECLYENLGFVKLFWKIITE